MSANCCQVPPPFLLSGEYSVLHNRHAVKKILLIIGIVVILLAVPATVFLVSQRQELRKRAAPATNISFTPASVTKKVGETFSLEVTVDTGENQVIAADLIVVFDPTKLEAQTITNGPLFPNVLTSGVVERGSARITVGAASSTAPVKGSGVGAVVRLKALEKTDTPVSVRFAPSTFVGAIGESTTNVLVGSSPASVTVMEDPSALPTPTLTPTTSPIATASSMTIPTVTLSPTPTNEASTTALLIIGPAKEGVVGDDTPKISGKAPPGSTITLTIYSTPRTVVVTADASGNWSYTPPTALEPGPHSIVATAQTPSGSTQTASSSFVVAAGAENTSPSTQSAIPVSGDPSWTILLVFIGSFLILGGIAVPVIVR